MARAADGSHDVVEIVGDDLDARIDAAPPGTAADPSGITLLADVVLQGRADTVATVRVHRTDELLYAVILVRDGVAQLRGLERRRAGFAVEIPLAAGETLHLTVVMSLTAAALSQLEAQVAQGGMGAGGAEEAESAEEPPVEAFVEDRQPDGGIEGGFGGGFGSGLGGGFGGDAALAPPPVDMIPPPAPAPPPVAAARPEPEPEPGPTPKPGVDGGTLIDAHVAAQMPAGLFDGVPFELLVTLARDEVKIARGAAGDDKPIRVRKRGDIRISVQAQGMEVAAGEASEAVVKLPARGAVSEHRFHLVPGEPGIGRVSVVVQQAPSVTPLAVIALSSMILPADEAPAAPVDGEPLRGETVVSAPPAAIAKLPTIAIEETFSHGHSVLRITAKVGRASGVSEVCLLDKAGYVDGIYAKLSEIRADYVDAVHAKTPAEAALSQAEEGVRELGVRIARELFGDEINALLWDRRDRLDHLVVQTSGELDIPWEIVHLVRVGEAAHDDTSLFLADKGMTRWLWGTRRPTRLAVAADRAVAIAPLYDDETLRLSGTEDEVQALAVALTKKPLGAVTRAEVRERIGSGFDLLHFAGHGRWRDSDPRGQEIALAAYAKAHDDGSAAYSDADAREDFTAAAGEEASAPFVFLSACDVGRLQPGSTGLGGFAEVFLRGGAGVFIGCSWAVRDDVTSEFATTLYDHLFVRGETLGEAAAAARAAARAAHDLTALAFTVYADPRARVVRT